MQPAMYYPPALPPPREGRCACTLPFSLHLTVMILGIIGMILGIVFLIVYFSIGNIWFFLGGGLAFASGLQGILVYPGTSCFNCHIVLAVFNLVNVGAIGIACIFLITPFLAIWAIVVFVLELWVTIARFCCKSVGVNAGGAATELPVAAPAVVHVVHGQPGYDYGAGHAPTGSDGFKKPYGY